MHTIDMTRGFSIIHYVEATPEQAWYAWTEPVAIAQWWHLPLTSTPVEELEYDVRVGGHYIYTSIHHETEQRMVSGGIFREVQPYSRLVFTWGAPSFEPEHLPVATVTFEPTSDGTYMTFALAGVDGQAGDGAHYDTWANGMANLKTYLAQTAH